MKHLNCLLWALVAGIILCSCTITKRHFGNGYHIEWKKKYHESVPEPNTITGISTQKDVEEPISLIEDVCREPEAPAETQLQEIKPVPAENNPSIPSTDETVFREKSIPSELKEIPVKHTGNPESVRHLEEEAHQKIHPVTWALISVMALAVVSFGLIIGNIFFVFGVIGFAFIGMILGIIALVSLKMHPEKYRKKRLTKFFAMFLIIAGGVITLFTILVLVLSYFYL